MEWSRQRGEAESECITLGQLAVTYKSMELHQKSLDNFENSADVCRRLRKTPLLAENLEQMLLITSHYGLASSERLFEIASEAYEVNLHLFSAQKSLRINVLNSSIPAILES